MCDYSNGDLFWQKLPGIAFHWCDSLPAGYRIKTMADKDKKYQEELKTIYKTRQTLEKLTLVAEHPNPAQKRLDK